MDSKELEEKYFEELKAVNIMLMEEFSDVDFSILGSQQIVNERKKILLKKRFNIDWDFEADNGTIAE